MPPLSKCSRNLLLEPRNRLVEKLGQITSSVLATRLAGGITRPCFDVGARQKQFGYIALVVNSGFVTLNPRGEAYFLRPGAACRDAGAEWRPYLLLCIGEDYAKLAPAVDVPGFAGSRSVE